MTNKVTYIFNNKVLLIGIYYCLEYNYYIKKFYQRVEFLGDNILNFTISCSIFYKFISHSEAKLSLILSNLNGRNVIDLIRLITVKNIQFFYHNNFELIEIVIGMIYIDSNMHCVYNIIEKIFNYYIYIYKFSINRKCLGLYAQEVIQQKYHYCINNIKQNYSIYVYLCINFIHIKNIGISIFFNNNVCKKYHSVINIIKIFLF